MNSLRLLCIFLLIVIGTNAQNVGINQANPTNSLHITPVNIGDNPLRVDGIQAYTVNEDSSLLVINPSTGVVKYMNASELANSIISNSFITNLGDSLISNSNFINNLGDSLFLSQNFIDSLVSTIYNNGDTLLSNTTFITNLGDTLLGNANFVSNLGDSLFLNQSFIDNLNSNIYDNGDTLLYNADFINNLRDSIDTDVDSVTLVGTTLTIFENGNNVSVSLNNLADNDADPTNEIQAISKSGNTVTLSNGGGSFIDANTQLTEAQVDAFANNNGYLTSFTEVDGSVTNEIQTISKSGNTVTLSNGGGSFTDANTQLTEAQVDAFANNNGYLTSFTEVDGSTTNEIQNLGLSGNTLSITNGNNINLSAFNGDITGINAGAGLTGGGTSGTPTINAAANNGLIVNAGADRIQLGGPLTQSTTINQGAHAMTFNLNGTGDFNVNDNGTFKFSVVDNDLILMGNDSYWRDGSTLGTNLMSLIGDGNDGRLRIYENGLTSVDLDANSQFIFNEQGLDRDFRVESDGNANMLRVDASTNRVTVGSANTAGVFNVTGNSYHSDDIYLRDGAVNTGDVLVRMFDSNDDGVIDVYQNGITNHRIHGNGTTVFNEQGLSLDFRVESNTNSAMLFVDASANRLGIGTTLPTRTLDVNGNARIRTIATTTSTTVTPLYSDANGNIFKKSANIGTGPKFISPRTVRNSGAAMSTYVTYNASTALPAGATAAILDYQYAISGPDGGDVDAHVFLRRDASGSAYIMTRGRAAGDADSAAGGGQAVVPISASRTFQYWVQTPGFNQGLVIRLIGYY